VGVLGLCLLDTLSRSLGKVLKSLLTTLSSLLLSFILITAGLFFCPTCWAKRVKQNDDRLEFFFRVLEERDIKKVVLFTLTPPSHEGWDTSLVDKVRSAWRGTVSSIV